MTCPNIAKCPMYAQFRLQALLTVWKLQYCEGEYERCERRVLSLAGETVDDTLLPDGAHMRART